MNMANDNLSIQTISSKDLLVYLCLRRHKKEKTGEASVPIATIVKETSSSPVTVLTTISRLVDTGHIKCTKKGRANYYSFLSKINAVSFDFLDENISFSKKAEKATKVAYVEDSQDENQSPDTSKFKNYVVQLEKDIVQLKEHERILVAELDKMRKYIAAITGQEYTPLNLQ